MDHLDVVRLHAVEKYALGELSADLRDEFEEHYFDCAECAADVKHLATFVTVSRLILQEAPQAKEEVPAKSPKRAGWFAWLRPIIAVPALAALVAIVIFQNAVTIPSLKQGELPGREVAVFGSTYRLQGATRGENGSTIAIGATESFALDFDFTPSVTYPSYVGRLLNDKGISALRFVMKGELANTEIHVVVPAGKVQPGEYELVISGEGGDSTGNGTPAREVQRIPFTVTYHP